MLTDVRPGTRSRRAQRDSRLPQRPAARARHGHHRSRVRGHRRQPGPRDRGGRRALPGVRARRRRAAAARSTCPRSIAADMEQSQVSIFAVHVQRNELALAHADDRHRQSPARCAMRTWSTSTGRSCSRACAPIIHKVDRLSTKVHRHRPRRAARCARRRRRGSDFTATLNPELQVAQDERPDQPRQVGQPARRRGVHDARRTSTARFVIDGVVGDYLCERFGSLEDDAADGARQGQPAGRGALARTRSSRRLLELHAHRRELRSRRRVRDRHQHRAHATSSATSCRTRSSPASTSPSAIPYGAHTGADWYSSTHIDVVGTRFDIWVDDRQIMADGKFLID